MAINPFLEEQLPIGIKMGATYGDEYNVKITNTKGGSEYRRLVHSYPVRHYSIGFINTNSEIWTKVLAIYHRAYGMYAGFRVKALDDFSTNGHVGVPTMLDQNALYVSSGVYQLQKVYGAGGTPLSIGLPVRTIFKPVAGTVVVAKNGVLVSSGVTVDTTTGRVTISPAPLIGDTVTAGCYFDIPFRFDSRLDLTHTSADVRDAPNIDIIELIVL